MMMMMSLIITIFLPHSHHISNLIPYYHHHHPPRLCNTSLTCFAPLFLKLIKLPTVKRDEVETFKALFLSNHVELFAIYFTQAPKNRNYHYELLPFPGQKDTMKVSEYKCVLVVNNTSLFVLHWISQCFGHCMSSREEKKGGKVISFCLLLVEYFGI